MATIDGMPVISKLAVQKKRENRVNVYLDGKFAFGCNKRVVERFELKAGLELSEADVERILEGEMQQGCFDRAIQYLSRRMHSRKELEQKLRKADFADQNIAAAMDRLTKLGYLDDAEFARQKLLSGQRKLMGSRRVMQELRKSGVDGSTAQRAIEDHFSDEGAKESAQTLIDKNLARLSRLDVVTAKRRLIGLLQRRGFDYETIKPMVEKTLGGEMDLSEE